MASYRKRQQSSQLQCLKLSQVTGHLVSHFRIVTLSTSGNAEQFLETYSLLPKPYFFLPHAHLLHATKPNYENKLPTGGGTFNLQLVITQMPKINENSMQQGLIMSVKCMATGHTNGVEVPAGILSWFFRTSISLSDGYRGLDYD